MRLDKHVVDNLMKRFPYIKLSYETTVHKKVTADLYYIIPRGKKYFAWFTYHRHQHVCFLLEISRQNQLRNIEVYPCCFDSSLANGTVLYGTLVNINSRLLFSTENIYYYKGNNVSNLSEIKKIQLFKTIFSEELKAVAYTSKCLLFYLPVVKMALNDAIQECLKLSYAVYCIQCRNAKTKESYKNYINRSNVRAEAIFAVTADIQNDIYNLAYNQNGKIEYHNVAMIPDYKTSVMMNKLFRNIKENANLDSLEESDSEEEFENMDLDKFVDLEKCYHMICTYHTRFKKWTPISVVKDSCKIVGKEEVRRLETNNFR